MPFNIKASGSGGGGGGGVGAVGAGVPSCGCLLY